LSVQFANSFSTTWQVKFMVVLRALAFFSLLLSCGASRIDLVGHSQSRVKQQFETKHNAGAERKALGTQRGDWIGGLQRVPAPGRFQPQLHSPRLNVPVTMQPQGPPDLTRRALLTGVAGASIAWPNSASGDTIDPSVVVVNEPTPPSRRQILEQHLDLRLQYLEENPPKFRKAAALTAFVKQKRSELAQPHSVNDVDKMIAEVDAFMNLRGWVPKQV